MQVSIEKQSDGTYIAYNTDGEKVILIGTGETVKEAKEDFFNSIEEIKETYIELNEAIPAYLSTEVIFRFDINSLFEYYSMFNVSALGRYLGINETLMRQYRNGSACISDRQLEKIENGIHRLGTELSVLRLV